MGRHPLVEPGPPSGLPHRRPHRLPSDRTTARVEEDPSPPGSRVEVRPHVAQIAPQRAQRRDPDRHDPLFRALSEDGGDPLHRVDRREGQLGHLGDAHTRRVEELQHRPVTPIEPLRLVRSGEQALDLLRGQEVGEPALGPRRHQPVGRIGVHDAFGQEEGVVRSQGGLRPSDRRRREPGPLELEDPFAERLRRDQGGVVDAPRGHELPPAAKVPTVGGDGPLREAPLERQVVVELLDPEGAPLTHADGGA